LVVLGEIELEAAKAMDDRGYVLDAITAFEESLQLESVRPHWAVFQGLNLRERERVQSIIDRARTSLETPPTKRP